MGYTTEFRGKWNLNMPLDDTTFNFLTRLNNTRRMKRNVLPIYGVEGEFYVEGKDSFGQDRDASVVDYNEPSKTQPSLWCHWIPTEDRLHIEWDGGEKFYGYIEWIRYIISKILAPRGYVLNGRVDYRGEDFDDQGSIEIIDNVVDGKTLAVDYSINKLLGVVVDSPQRLKGEPVGKVNIFSGDDLTLKAMMVAVKFDGTLDEFKNKLRDLLS